MQRFRWPSRRLSRDDSGFTLIEAIIALSVLALSILFISTNVVASATGAQRSEAREIAAEIASSTLQQTENLGVTTVTEGLFCSNMSTSGNTSGQCLSLGSPDPNHHLNFDNSNGCWYYGTIPSSSTASSGDVVPTTTSVVQAPPLQPYVSPPNTINGTKYQVVLYPMYDLTTYHASAPVSCVYNDVTNLGSVPITVVVQVSWGSNPANNLTMQTVIYQPPTPTPNTGSCPSFGPVSGANYEASIANPEVNGTVMTAPYTTPVPVTSTGPSEPTLSFLSIDEGPPLNPPVLCLLNSNGQPEVQSWSSSASGPAVLTTTQYGTSSTNLYLNPKGDSRIPVTPCSPSDTKCTVITPVHPSEAGSKSSASPQYNSPYWCSGTGCDFEAQYSFQLPPTTPTGFSYTQATVFVWDAEGDGDYFTWTIQNS